MGLFDIAVFDTTCPECGQSHEWRAQFKYGYCRQHEYRLGDAICWFDAPGRPVPLSDTGENVGGRVRVAAALESPCATCGYAGGATLWLRDNTLERAEIANNTDGAEFVHIEPGHRWMRFWSRRAAGSANEDRLEVSCRGSRWTIVVADGAGGMSGGALAARAIATSLVALGADAEVDARGWCELIEQMDRKLEADPAAGETTVVVVQVHDGELWGASAGDSGALLLHADGAVDLTAHQHAKPLVGSGTARPIGIQRQPIAGRLLVATDGLLKYVQPAKLCALASTGDLRGATDALLAAATLPSGNLHDDVAIVLGETVG